jgi:hypothetical protein
VRHRNLALEHDVTNSPPRNAIDQVKSLEQKVALRRNRSVSPLVRAQRYSGTRIKHERRIVCCHRQEAPRRGLGDAEQPVVPTGAQPAHGSHGVAAEAIGEQPLALNARVEIGADLCSEGD